MNTTYDNSNDQNPAQVGADVDAERAEPVGDSSDSGGARPSNTAPVKYSTNENQSFKILHYGIDSLYLSYPGTLTQKWDEALSALKACAQSRDPNIQATAQIELSGHLFEVLDRGRGLFAYILADNQYQIALSSSTARQMPLAIVQLSSELLHSFGSIEAEERIWPIFIKLSDNVDEPRLSRADLYVDFVADIEFRDVLDEQWMTQARRIDRYQIDGAFTGWAFGRSDMHARLYNKSLEIKTSGKDYFRPIWLRSGWDGHATVWRLEFQFRRERLKQFGANTLAEFLDRTGDLWLYATENWLRLTSPNPSDSNRARWPLHPLWPRLSALEWGNSGPPTQADVPLQRPPSDATLFERGLWPLSSYMARECITNPHEAYQRFLSDAEKHHSTYKEKSLDEYLLTKLALKGRKYNTLKSIRLEDGSLSVEPFGDKTQPIEGGQ